MKSPYCIEPGCDRWALSTSPYCMSHLQAQSKEKRMDSQPTVAQRPLKRGSVKRVSDKQADINDRLHEVYEMLDAEMKHEWGGLICTAYPMGDYYLIDHSHTISRDRCKKLGKPELIYDPDNIQHCSRVAHEEWDNYSPKMLRHANWQKRMDFIKLHDQHDWERRMGVWALHNKPEVTI